MGGRGLSAGVEDYLQGSGLGAVSESSYEVTHTPDESTKTDTVHIALDAAFERASLSSSYAATYQYNKASDLWTLIRGGQWQTETVDSYRLDYSPAPLLSIMRKQDPDAEIKTEPINMMGFAPLTEPLDYWHIDAADGAIIYLEAADADSAYEFFLTICSALLDLPDGVTEEANAAGENYNYLRYRDGMDSGEDLFLICQDNKIFVAYGEIAVLDEILQTIGLISDGKNTAFDVETEARQHIYRIGEKYLEEGDLDNAIEIFRFLEDFNDSAARLEEAIEKKNAQDYAKAEKMLEDKDYPGALAAFEALGSYKDSAQRIDEVKAAAAAGAGGASALSGSFTASFNGNAGNVDLVQDYEFIPATTKGLLNADSRLFLDFTLTLDGAGHYELLADAYCVEAGQRCKIGDDTGLGLVLTTKAEGTYVDNGDGTVTTSAATHAVTEMATDTYSMQMKGPARMAVGEHEDDGVYDSAEYPEVLALVPETVWTLSGGAIEGYFDPNTEEEPIEGPVEETPAAGSAEVQSVTIVSDDEGTKMTFNSDGTYCFDFESYSIVDAGTWSFENGVLTVKDVNGVEYTAEGETLHLHYGYSGAPDQLTGEFTIDPVIFSQE